MAAQIVGKGVGDDHGRKEYFDDRGNRRIHRLMHRRRPQGLPSARRRINRTRTGGLSAPSQTRLLEYRYIIISLDG